MRGPGTRRRRRSFALRTDRARPRTKHGFHLLVVPMLALATGCVVQRTTYLAEVEHARQLAEKLELVELQNEEFQRRIDELETTGETLALERESLSQERLALLAEIEAMRKGNAELSAQLERERRVREQREAEIKEVAGTYQNLVEQLENELESGKLEIHRLRGRLQVRALEQILFDSGSATIKPEGREVLSKLAVQLKAIPDHRIRVEGHTDDVPIATERFPSNWELAGARAAGVVRLLIEQGLDARKLSAVAFADQQPIATNDTPDGRARNRRIEIVLVPEETD
ncbi:MAG: OmpA family protein [Myxococcota bacterium]